MDQTGRGVPSHFKIIFFSNSNPLQGKGLKLLGKKTLTLIIFIPFQSLKPSPWQGFDLLKIKNIVFFKLGGTYLQDNEIARLFVPL